MADPAFTPIPCLAEIGEETIVEPGTAIGHRYHPSAGPARIGRFGIIRMGTIIYGDVSFGDYLQTGHYTVIRAQVSGGHFCAIGNHTTFEGRIRLGNGVRIMHHVYIPSRTTLGDRVFVGPGTVFLNDKTPGRYGGGPISPPAGATVEEDVMIGGGCLILPGIRIGAGSFIAAGAMLTKDIPPGSFVRGAPASAEPMPDRLSGGNDTRLVHAPLDLWHPKSSYESPGEYNVERCP